MNTTYFSETAGLIAEHQMGRYQGLLTTAQDFLLRHRATCGFASEEEIAEAAWAEGIGEAEIAAALEMESGDYFLPTDPRGDFWGIK